MYYCSDCGCDFESAAVFKETHGLASPPFEEVRCCPLCGSVNIKLKPQAYCQCCGAKLAKGERGYCSPACRKKGEEMRRRELKKHNNMLSSSLFQTVREVDEYNAKNHTDLSYGQYVTLIKPRRKRGGKK